MELPREKFRIIISEEANRFIASLPEKAKFKILYNLKKSTYVLDKELFKRLGSSEIWEFRTLYSGLCYRLLAFWDVTSTRLVIVAHGFIKKSKKTPKNEIERAERYRKLWLESRYK